MEGDVFVQKTYSSIEEFYAENEARRQSGEADYGCWWTVPRMDWPRWRVTYIQKTGEVYAVQLKDGGLVKVLGMVPPDDDRIYYRTLDHILEGWADAMHKPGSLVWVERKLN